MFILGLKERKTFSKYIPICPKPEVISLVNNNNRTMGVPLETVVTSYITAVTNQNQAVL